MLSRCVRNKPDNRRVLTSAHLFLALLLFRSPHPIRVSSPHQVLKHRLTGERD